MNMALALLAVALAGAVKGIVGLGFPPLATALIGTVLDSRTAVITVALPSLLLNAAQAWQGRDALRDMKGLVCVVVALVPGSIVGAYLFTTLPEHTTSLLLGLAIMAYVLPSLFRFEPRISQRLLFGLGIGVGFVAGILGGSTGIYGPLLALYLSAVSIGKKEFPAKISLMLLVGQLPQIITYTALGLITAERLTLSLAMIPSATLGLGLGTVIRSRISQGAFATSVRVALAVIGAKLIRDGLGLAALGF